MRKILISILLLALVAVLGLMISSGLVVADKTLGYSIRQIVDKNTELDESIVQLRTKIDKEYETANANLKTSFDKLQKEKAEYEKKVEYMSSDEVQEANKEERYKLDYLWTKIGLNATKNNLVLKADVSNGSSGVQNYYNISFTAIGEYLSISEFVYAIEKDDTLGFRIEEFSVVPYSEERLQATFIIKNVLIDPESLSGTSVSTGTVTNNPNGNNNSDYDGPVRSVGGVTVMSDYNNPSNANNGNNANTNTGNNNTNPNGNNNTNTGNTNSQR